MTQQMLAATQRKQNLAGLAVPAFLIALPAALFNGVLFRHLVDLPISDDYDAVLRFLNEMVQAKGVAAKLSVLGGEQHNEYKLFFGNAVAWAQFSLLGHVNFAWLCVLGDSAVLVVALLLWRMLLPGEKDLARRLAYFVPVAWLLFQLEYWETLNYAMAALQNLWVIVFCLGAIMCLQGRTRMAYSGAAVLYTLAIAASGEGFVLLPLGLVILGLQRRFARAAGRLAVTAVCIAAYAYHYNPMSSQAQPHGSVFNTLPHMRPDYVIVFAGNAAAITPGMSGSVGVCLTLGAILLLLLGWLAWRGYMRRNPLVSYCVLFLLLTAVGVAGLRSEMGLMQGLSCRYTIYGALLLIFAWMAVAEEFLQHRSGPLLNDSRYLVLTVVAIAFSLCTSEIGYLRLAGRERDTVKAMAAFERGAPGSTEGPEPQYAYEAPNLSEYRSRVRAIFSESIRLGVYEPPNF